MYAPFGAGVLHRATVDLRRRRPVPRRRRRRRPRRPRRGRVDRAARPRGGRLPERPRRRRPRRRHRRARAPSAGPPSPPTTTRSRAALHGGLAAIPGVRLLGHRPQTDTLPLATFVVEGIPHALVAARLSAEFGIGVRHGCFCAHPYLLRLLGLSTAEVAAYREAVLAGDRRTIPGAVRASAGLSTTPDDVDRLVARVADIASGDPRRSTTTKTPAPATTGRRATSPAGRPRSGAKERPALAGNHSRPGRSGRRLAVGEPPPGKAVRSRACRRLRRRRLGRPSEPRCPGTEKASPAGPTAPTPATLDPGGPVLGRP